MLPDSIQNIYKLIEFHKDQISQCDELINSNTITPGARERFIKIRSEFFEELVNDHKHLQDLLHENKKDCCTSYAMEFAEENGHLDILKWLYENRKEDFMESTLCYLITAKL